ncbi:hypothetical protein RclHR1_14410005 [Rhizophagus clarus]|uniref:Uncharacterized protein n=1 Tax=Rhizophagus clarus TaxID=94130 RepID=A0A2Z6QPZ5_9GLOM|nr:hypothetical protein RclHR1_14410005 [Rhizophagus clarus]
MLEKFPVLQFVSADLSNQEIDQFEIDAQNWVCMFCCPTQGHMNNSIQIPGLYQKEDITPYMHVFAKHIPKFMRQLKEKGLSLLIFSTSIVGAGLRPAEAKAPIHPNSVWIHTRSPIQLVSQRLTARL